jgi:hypothetical protein
MADEAYRAAERRARESGEVADAARLLLERVRCGELQAGALSLAAYVGDPAAGAALGVRLEVDEADELARDRWARGLVAWGWPVFPRGILAAVLAELELAQGVDESTRSEVLALFEAFWNDPTEARRRDIATGRAIADLPVDAHPLQRLTKCATIAAGTWAPPHPSSRALPPLLAGISVTPARVRPRLLPWALSTRDPLRGPAGPDLVREALEAGTPRGQRELADRLRASIGREVLLTRLSARELRFVPRSVNDESARGEVPGEQRERFFLIRSIVTVRDPVVSS